MDKKYWQPLLKITDILTPMQIKGLHSTPNSYEIIIEEFDLHKTDEINNICDTVGMEWELTPAPSLRTNGIRESEHKYLLKSFSKRIPNQLRKTATEQMGAKLKFRPKEVE